MSLILLFVVLISLAIGSFLNVVIIRLPIMLEHRWRKDCEDFLQIEPSKQEKFAFNLGLPASHCVHCHHPLSILDNIPILSFLWLKARCRYCAKKISLQYPIIEILSALSATIMVLYFGVTLKTLIAVIFTWFLLCLSAIDWQKQILPDVINLLFLWLGLFLSLFGIFTDAKSAIIGAIIGYSVLWFINKSYGAIRKKQGIGYGDFKLLAALGAWLGWQQIPFIILISTLTGAVVGIILLLSKRHRWENPIPYGPYLAFAGWLAMLFGNTVLHWYMSAFTL